MLDNHSIHPQYIGDKEDRRGRRPTRIGVGVAALESKEPLVRGMFTKHYG